MIVSAATFRKHLHWLAEHFEIVQLSAWIDAATRGEPLPARACAVTFDDGWRDNYDFAFPQLRELSVPATVFAVSHMVGTNEMFWPNRLGRILEHVGAHASSDPSLAWLSELQPLPFKNAPSPDELSAAIAACKRLPDTEISARLAETETTLGLQHAVKRTLLNWDELRRLAGSGLIEVGSHTCRHTRLSEHTSPDVLASEVIDSRRRLELELAVPVGLFCYPNGDTTPAARRLVAEHYNAAVTTRTGINTQTTPVYDLRRIGLHEDISRTRRDFLARLSCCA